jgi:predicted 3-demethylubiquinone-9 3-methyltransferase (glyoxalase superfamily)
VFLVGLAWLVRADMLADKDAQRAARVTNAMLQMTKFDIAALKRAYKGD